MTTAAIRIPLPSAPSAHRPNSRELLPLGDYDLVIVSCSFGKDSLALVLHLLDLGVPPGRIQLWHQCVDGAPNEPAFMDWPCTLAYGRAVAAALGVRLLLQYREGGFKGEMLKHEARSRPVHFQTQAGAWAQAGGIKGAVSTRLLLPQPTGDLRVRWCSGCLKIDAADLALCNDPALRQGRFLFLTGERRQESPRRAAYAEREAHRVDCGRRRVDVWRAVIDWDEARVWDAMRRHGVVPHPAYRLGFPRVSCALCIFGRPDQWASVRKVAPAAFAELAAYEASFARTLHQGTTIPALADQGTPYPETDDQTLVALAMGDRYAVPVLCDPAVWQMPAGAFKRGGGPT